MKVSCKYFTPTLVLPPQGGGEKKKKYKSSSQGGGKKLAMTENISTLHRPILLSKINIKERFYNCITVLRLLYGNNYENNLKNMNILSIFHFGRGKNTFFRPFLKACPAILPLLPIYYICC